MERRRGVGMKASQSGNRPTLSAMGARGERGAYGVYRDLGEYVETLERHGFLVRIKRAVNIGHGVAPRCEAFNSEVRRSRKGLPIREVTDSRGRRYKIPVLVSAWRLRGILRCWHACRGGDTERWTRSLVTR